MNTIRIRLFVLAMTTALAAIGVTATAQAAAAPYCGITWGSLPKAHSASDTDMINDVRAGRHTCYDRLVVDLGGQGTTFGSYDVRYVPVVLSEGQGSPLPVRGDADLQITLKAPAYDQYGHPTFTPANPNEVVDLTGYSTFRQLRWGGSYEGYTTMALGVRARLPFRVFTLAGTPNSGDGPKLVIDVAHRW
jgi:hypothetical protein